MKKRYMFLLLFGLIFIPKLVSAEVCSVVSGNGINIGDEIKCGTENFYVTDYNEEDNTTTMLAKYNLYVGKEVYKIEFDKVYTSRSDASVYVKDTYGIYATDIEVTDSKWKLLYSEDKGGYYGVLAYDELEYTEVKQSELAIGAHGGERGEPEFPEIGVINNNMDLYDDISYAYENYDSKYSSDGFFDFDFIYDTEWKQYLDEYENTLVSYDIKINELTILTVNDVDNLIYKLSDKNLPLELWKNNWNYSYDDIHTDYYILGDLKEYIPRGYEWIYSTTYWLRTSSDTKWPPNLYFIDTLGYLCNAQGCSVAVGAGIRPLITITNDQIEYPKVEEEKEEVKAIVADVSEENPNTNSNISKILIITSIIGIITILVLSSRKKMIKKYN